MQSNTTYAPSHPWRIYPRTVRYAPCSLPRPTKVVELVVLGARDDPLIRQLIGHLSREATSQEATTGLGSLSGSDWATFSRS